MTASVGVGKAKHLGTAKEWVKKIMANLDADELATVRDERQELSKHVNIPEEGGLTFMSPFFPIYNRKGKRQKRYSYLGHLQS